MMTTKACASSKIACSQSSVADRRAGRSTRACAIRRLALTQGRDFRSSGEDTRLGVLRESDFGTGSYPRYWDCGYCSDAPR